MLEQLAVPASPWRHRCVGEGQIERTGSGLRLLINPTTASAYSDAQIDDYGAQQGQRLLRRPPLRLRICARFSHEASELRGTAGFGFWNYPSALPFSMPQAIWFFFGSPPGDMPLTLNVPGRGWKAATLDTGRPRALALLPLAPLAVPLMWSPALYRGLWPPIQRALGLAETLVRVPMTTWHDYVLEWGTHTSRFLVDGRVLLDEAPSPHGPLCFVTWIDNQYLVATPQGKLRAGLLATATPQWLEINGFELTAL